MQLRIGYELGFECPQPTPMILMLNVHFSRVPDIVVPDHLHTDPSLAVRAYRDSFGNWCSRIVAPRGRTRIFTDALINDRGTPDVVAQEAMQTSVDALPEETLGFLLGSRYCETDRLSPIAWELFANAPTGAGRVQAICDFVHGRVEFGYAHARPTKTAWETYEERGWRLPGLRPPGNRVLPMHEHSRAILHRLSRRRGRAAGGRTHGFLRMVRGVFGRRLVHVRRAAQYPAYRREF